MKKRYAFILSLSILFLVACSQNPKSNNTGPLVYLDLGFDTLQGSLNTQAIPFDEDGLAVVTRFEVQVFDTNDALVKFNAENVIDPIGTVDTLTIALNSSIGIGLSTGDYRFESKAFAPNIEGGEEVVLAVGTNTFTVNADATNIALSVTTITDSFTFQTSVPLNFIVPGQTLDMMLVVTAPGGYLVPLADFGVTYTVDEDNVEQSVDSVRGLRLVMKDILVDNSISVMATVSGTSPSGSTVSLEPIDAVANIPLVTSSTGPVFDTQAPSFSFVEPSLTAGEIATITGTAIDNIGIHKIQVYDGPVLIGSSLESEFSDLSVAEITFSATAWGMSIMPEERSYELYGVAYDTSGNQSDTSYADDTPPPPPPPPPPPVEDSSGLPRLSAGGGITCGIRDDGKAYCWGSGNKGLLGTGNNVSVNSPAAIENPAGVTTSTWTWKSISAGIFHSCGIANDGKVYCWGSSNTDILGTGTTGTISSPTIVLNPAGVSTWKSISVGNSHSCGISNDDNAYCWGWGFSGQLGVGNNINSASSPTTVVNPDGVSTWKSISAGSVHSCGIGNNDKAYCWGTGSNGRLGTGTTNSPKTPAAILNPEGVSTWKSIRAGHSHSCGIGNDDKAYCWGSGVDGRVGAGDDSTTSNNPRPIAVLNPAGVSTWKSISVGDKHSCGIANDDKAYCWGSGAQGRLGVGDDVDTSTALSRPTAVLNPAGVSTSTWTWKSISLGASHSCGIGNDDKPYCWGLGHLGQLGTGNNNFATSPTAVAAYPND